MEAQMKKAIVLSIVLLTLLLAVANHSRGTGAKAVGYLSNADPADESTRAEALPLASASVQSTMPKTLLFTLIACLMIVPAAHAQSSSEANPDAQLNSLIEKQMHNRRGFRFVPQTERPNSYGHER